MCSLLLKRWMIVGLVIAFTGCTHNFLRRNTIRQASTISDVLYFQVMDNIATFCANQGALPHFAILNDGTTQATDQATPMGGLKWNPTTITEETLGLNANRQLTENWKMAPVTSAGRLKRMRCALQFVVSPPAFEVEATESLIEGDPTPWYVIADEGCTQCLAELTKMQLFPKPSQSLIVSGAVKVKGDRYYFQDLAKAHEYAAELRSALACNFPSGWYCCSTEKPPKDACYVGRCGKTYTWVCPDGIDDLSRFTITLLTLATLDPPSSFVLVKRATKSPNGEDLIIEGQVPGNVINFQLPELIVTKAMADTAASLSQAVKDPKHGFIGIPKAEATRASGLLNRFTAGATINPNDASALRATLTKMRNTIAASNDENKEEVVENLSRFVDQLDAVPSPVPAEPSILDQPGFMPFSNSNAGPEFVPQAQ